MNIIELKQAIEQNNLEEDFIICYCKDNTARFIATQYYHYYAMKNDLEIKLIEDLREIILNPFSSDNILYIYNSDSLDEVPFIVNNRLWVICGRVAKDVRSERKDHIISIPKLEDWQIKDYIVSITEVTDEQAESLMQTYKDVRKLDIEAKKLSIFRQNMFEEFKDQLIYIEDNPIFNLTNALIQRDKDKLKKVVSSGVDDIEPFALIALLSKNLKAVIDIQLAKNPTAESLGMSGKQFWAVSKYSCNHYTREELLYLYDFILGIDSRIKSGEVDTYFVVNYIIGRFLQFMR